MLRGIPHPHDVKSAISDRAVMAQLTEGCRSSSAHDQCVCAVVCARQLRDVTVKSGNEQRRHSSLLGPYGRPTPLTASSPGSAQAYLPSCTACTATVDSCSSMPKIG